MKTVRQILLERHEPTEPALDSLRRNVIREFSTPATPWWRVAWREMVVAARPAWVGLGAMGILAIALNLSSMETRSAASGTTRWSQADPKTAREAREERSRLWAELRDATAPSPVPQTPPRNSKAPPHRSQMPVNIWPV